MQTAGICLFDDKRGNDPMKNINEKKIGMVGFGHLGSSIAEALVNGGFPIELNDLAQGKQGNNGEGLRSEAGELCQGYGVSDEKL